MRHSFLVSQDMNLKTRRVQQYQKKHQYKTRNLVICYCNERYFCKTAQPFNQLEECYNIRPANTTLSSNNYILTAVVFNPCDTHFQKIVHEIVCSHGKQEKREKFRQFLQFQIQSGCENSAQYRFFHILDTTDSSLAGFIKR